MPQARAWLHLQSRFHELGGHLVQHIIRRWRIVALVALTAVVLIAGVSGLRVQQARYYTGIFWQNHSGEMGTHPLYRPLMSGTDQTWLLSKDSAHSFQPMNLQSNGPLGLVLSDGTAGQFMVALAPHTYNNVEVDDFAFQFGQADPIHDGVGLVLRANPATGDMITLNVSQPTATWWLGKYRHGAWTYLQPRTHSDAILRYPKGSSMVLAVIARGDQYIVFINYEYVGTYTDSSLHMGRVGVYVNDGTITGNLADFSVWRTV